MIIEDQKKITVAIPSKKFDSNLRNCISNIRKFYNNIEIFILLDKKTSHIFDKKISLFFFNNKNIGYKRNFAAKKSTKDFICFIDSDAYPIKNWLENFLLTFKLKKKLIIAGGPNISPETNDIERKIISKVRQLPFVTLNNFIKYKSVSRYTDFLPSCNLFVKRKEYLKYGGMDEEVVAGEEIKLFYNLNRLKKEIFFINKAIIFHKDRNFKNFLRQRMTYGIEANLIFLYPCKQTFLIALSTLPFLNFMSVFILFPFSDNFFFQANLSLFLLTIFLCFFFTLKIYHKSFFIKHLIPIIISIYGPGLGFCSQFISDKKTQKKNYRQE